METLEEERWTTTVDRSAQNANISFPREIIEEILSRLPVKSILRFRSVSKPWLSYISDPSFTKLHYNRATAHHRTGLFFSAYDDSTRKRYFLSAAHDGGPLTHLMTLEDAYSTDTISAEHLNGLVCFTNSRWFPDYTYAHAFVLNPSTRKIYKIPDPASFTNYTSVTVHMCYFFGFDENEHKILLIRKLLEPATVEIMIFSMSNYSWRKIDVEPPILGFNWDCLSYGLDDSVCVNSVVHIVLHHTYDILAFDLKTEKFSIITTPQGVRPHESWMMYVRNGKTFFKLNKPHIMMINGCVGVVCHDRVTESNEIHIWILQDYANHVWVSETIKFPESSIELDGPFPFPLPLDVNMDDIIFSSRKVSENVMSVPIYNKKRRCFKSLQFTLLGHQFLCSETVNFNQIKCYVESILPL